MCRRLRARFLNTWPRRLCIRSGSHAARVGRYLAVLQQSQFRQRFLRFAFSRRTRIAFQKLFIRFLRQPRIPQMLALQLRRSQNRILAILARRIFAHQELVSVHGRLIVSAPKTVAHLGVKFRNGQQGIRDFRSSRRNHGYAAIDQNYLFVIRECAFFARFAVQRRALLFRSRKLRCRRLALQRRGGGGFRIRFCRCRRNKKQRSAQRRKNRRKAGEPHSRIFSRQKHLPASPQTSWPKNRHSLQKKSKAKKIKLPRRQFRAPGKPKKLPTACSSFYSLVNTMRPSGVTSLWIAWEPT